MSKQNRRIIDLPTNNPTIFLEVEVCYTKGGMNYFAGGCVGS